MNEWVSIIALTACFVLAFSSLRAQRLGAGRTLVLALAWGAIFLLVAAVFSAVSPEPSPWRP